MEITQKTIYDNNYYKIIVKKLGFDPENYIPEKHKYHDDNYESPFSVLNAEETRFLLDYLKNKGK